MTTEKDVQIEKLVEGLHTSPTMAVVVVAGAGVQSLVWLLAVPGASRTLLEAHVTYSYESLKKFIGRSPKQTVSVQVATDMARLAYIRAAKLSKGNTPVVGIGCTATIETRPHKRGDHRCHVVSWNERGMITYSLKMLKGLRDRVGEENLVSRLILRALAEASCIEFQTPLGLDNVEKINVDSVSYSDPIKALLAGHVRSVTVHSDGTMVAEEPVRGGVLPGSFNPLHEGHELLAAVAARTLNEQVTFELSVANVDKPPLEELEIRRRLAQFKGKASIVLTSAMVFRDKASLLHGCTFVVGWDTAVRLVDPRYYGGEEIKMLTSLDEMKQRGCRFLVAGRSDGETFHTLSEIDIPQGLDEMFTSISGTEFRCDLSSTNLRLAGQ